MGFHDKTTGAYIGGWKAWVIGLLCVPIVAFLIDFLPWVWIFRIGLGLVILWFVICIIWNIIDEHKKKSKNSQ